MSTTTTETVLLTGAAGGVGTLLRPRLRRADRVLRLLDIAEVPPGADDEQIVRASVTDLDAMTAASQGASSIVHLGGLSLEAAWPDIMQANINGTYCVLEAARRAGVRRVVLASSNHAVGFAARTAAPVPDASFPRPDTYYGVSKVAAEALGSLYHDRYGLEVIALRIGSCFERPRSARMLSTWLSPDDCARLVEAALAAPDPGFQIVWGVSANTRNGFDLTGARALGYEPQDDAEQYAAEVLAMAAEPAAAELDASYVGGTFCSPDLDAPLP